MSEIIIHIGLAKTGTTTLQSYFFAKYPNYLGRKSIINNDVETLRRIVRTQSYNKINKDKFDAWVNSIYKMIQESFLGYGSVIYSDEILYAIGIGRIFMNNHSETLRAPVSKQPIIVFLNELNKNKWKFGQVRVILTLRNQAEWLASLYAQDSDRIFRPSTEDFEKKAKKLIELNSSFLDWSEWVGTLQKTVGENNVCVLLMEEMNTKQYRKQLYDFINIRNPETEKLILGNVPRKNIKSTDDGKWQTMPIKYAVAAAISNTWPYNSEDSLRRKAINLAKNNSKYTDYLLRLIYNRKREKEIYLRSEFKAKIIEISAPFNQKLSKQLNKNLKPLGY